MKGRAGVADAGPEIWFYHLERSTLDQVLPGLLEKTRERGWRALVRAADERLLDDIDERLWIYRDDSFLAHGRASEPEAARQPILLTDASENPNGAQALFIVDDAQLGDTKGFDRCFIIFDGRDDTALQAARVRWKTLKDAGANLAYWKQSPEGRWEKAA
nr:DNA polymerase III subunit chi [Brevundimonas alba]